MAMARCLRLSVCHKSEFCQNGYMDRVVFLAWMHHATYPQGLVYPVLQGNTRTVLCNFALNSAL